MLKINKGDINKAFRPRRTKSLIYIAAAAAILIALSVTAIAANIFGIRDLVIPLPSASAPVSSVPPEEAVPSMRPKGPSADIIGTQGFPDSPEYKAYEEWKLFCEQYDEDGSIEAQVWDENGNFSNEYTEKYPGYGSYSQEMADKLEEIVAKHGLTLHGSVTWFNAQQFLSAINKDALIAGPLLHEYLAGGYYEDGTFSFRGRVTMPDGKKIEYWFDNNVKGTFSNDHIVLMEDFSGYKEWTYTTKSGVEVYLSLGKKQAILLTDLENSFVAVDVLTGTKGVGWGLEADPITEKDLEAFAEMFDFSVLK